jgi:hypothetical protein
VEKNKRAFPHFDRQLIERFASGNGTAFVGAGISMRSGLPSWAKLMEPLRTELGDRISPSATHLDVAELYEAEHNRFALVHYLKQELGTAEYQLRRTHDLIVSLPVQRIYTTNFDDLLERAANKKLIKRNVIHDAAHVGFSDTSTLSIVKLHGDLAAPGSLVISANDYYGYFTRNPAVADLLKVELQTHTVLFLGYSFSDPDFGMILGKVAAQSGPDRPLLYALQLNPLPLVAKALEKRGIKVIDLKVEAGTAEASKAVEHWLDCFLQTLHRYERRKRQQASAMSDVRDVFAIPKYKHSLIRLPTLRRIEDVLRADFPVIVVKGEAGVGKTQLVATAAANMLVPGGAIVVSDVFERIIWIRSASTGSPHTLDHILDTILNSIESFPVAGQTSEKKEDEANRMLEEHRVIVVIEDLEDDRLEDGEIARIKSWLEQVGSDAHPRSRIVVTSRSLALLGFTVEVGRLSMDEAVNMVNEHAESIMLRRAIPNGLPVGTDKWLAGCTLGNPQAIQLALGLFFGTGNGDATKRVLEDLPWEHNTNIELAFAALIDAIRDELKKPPDDKTTYEQPPSGLKPLADGVSWAEFEPPAHRILRAMLVFPDSEPVPAAMLRAVCGIVDGPHGHPNFATEAERCVRFGLLERDTRKDTFGLHRTPKKLLATSLGKSENDKSFDRLAEYLLDFLRDKRDHNVVCRPEIEEDYWNALVRDQMSKVDPYWPIINHVMSQAGTTPLITHFVLLLVHYMDSRFLNLDRAKFLKAAMEALATTPPDTPDKDAWSKRMRALLKIDALAWTYMENSEPDKAAEQIDEGLRLIDASQHQDLVALAEAWRARLACKRNLDEAYGHLELAEEAARNVPKKHWIHMRVKMISGDVLYRDSEQQRKSDNKWHSKLQEALAAYQQAEHLAERYGGEGDGYQTSPRIGLALLKQADDPNAPHAQDQAAQRFRKLVENSQVATGRLYGQYGNALIAANNNATREAIAQLEAIHREISHLGRGNVLLSLAEKLYRETLNRRPYYIERAGRR